LDPWDDNQGEALRKKARVLTTRKNTINNVSFLKIPHRDHPLSELKDEKMHLRFFYRQFWGRAGLDPQSQRASINGNAQEECKNDNDLKGTFYHGPSIPIR
jgi:hypothetical protein